MENIVSNRITELYDGVLNKSYTLQDFIEFISNNIENNRIKSYLRIFLQNTQELEQIYQLENAFCSPRFTFQSSNKDEPSIYYYYIKKMRSFGHYCMYISIPMNHYLHGKSHKNIQYATYSSTDDDDPTRWVFGWNYSRDHMLTITEIYKNYFSNINIILTKQIIDKNMIEEDVLKYMHFLESL